MSYTITESLRYFANNGFGIVVTNTDTYDLASKDEHPDHTIHLIDVAGYKRDSLEMKGAAALFNNYVAMLDSKMLSYESYPNKRPCIPHTYKTGQVVRSHLYGRLNAGKVITYCLQALLYDGQNTYGLTTDRQDVAPGAEKSWDSFMSEKLYRKRSTQRGHDSFDYHNITDDPFDDCDAPDIYDVFDVESSFNLRSAAYDQNKFYIQQMIIEGMKFVDYASTSVFPYRNRRIAYEVSTLGAKRKEYASLAKPINKEFVLAVDLETVGNYFFFNLYPGRRSDGSRKSPRTPQLEFLIEELKKNRNRAARSITKGKVKFPPFANLKLH